MNSVAADLAASGTLRASINLGNAVLAQGTPDAPSGITVDIARQIAARLDVPVEFVCFTVARDSFQAVLDNRADIGFLAIEPARSSQIAFTPPYVVIEGGYAVRRESPITTLDEVDRDGVRIGVRLGAAYDLYLTRTLQHAELVRDDDPLTVFREQGLEVVSGIRGPLTADVAADPDLRMLDGAFMQIQQAVATGLGHPPETIAFLTSVVEELKASGFVADSLRRAGQTAATVAAPQSA